MENKNIIKNENLITLSMKRQIYPTKGLNGYFRVFVENTSARKIYSLLLK